MLALLLGRTYLRVLAPRCLVLVLLVVLCNWASPPQPLANGPLPAWNQTLRPWTVAPSAGWAVRPLRSHLLPPKVHHLSTRAAPKAKVSG